MQQFSPKTSNPFIQIFNYIKRTLKFSEFDDLFSTFGHKVKLNQSRVLNYEFSIKGLLLGIFTIVFAFCIAFLIVKGLSKVRKTLLSSFGESIYKFLISTGFLISHYFIITKLISSGNIQWNIGFITSRLVILIISCTVVSLILYFHFISIINRRKNFVMNLSISSLVTSLLIYLYCRSFLNIILPFPIIILIFLSLIIIFFLIYKFNRAQFENNIRTLQKFKDYQVIITIVILTSVSIQYLCYVGAEMLVYSPNLFRTFSDIIEAPFRGLSGKYSVYLGIFFIAYWTNSIITGFTSVFASYLICPTKSASKIIHITKAFSFCIYSLGDIICRTVIPHSFEILIFILDFSLNVIIEISENENINLSLALYFINLLKAVSVILAVHTYCTNDIEFIEWPCLYALEEIRTPSEISNTPSKPLKINWLIQILRNLSALSSLVFRKAPLFFIPFILKVVEKRLSSDMKKYLFILNIAILAVNQLMVAYSVITTVTQFFNPEDYEIGNEENSDQASLSQEKYDIGTYDENKNPFHSENSPAEAEEYNIGTYDESKNPFHSENNPTEAEQNDYPDEINPFTHEYNPTGDIQTKYSDKLNPFSSDYNPDEGI